MNGPNMHHIDRWKRCQQPTKVFCAFLLFSSRRSRMPAGLCKCLFRGIDRERNIPYNGKFCSISEIWCYIEGQVSVSIEMLQVSSLNPSSVCNLDGF